MAYFGHDVFPKRIRSLKDTLKNCKKFDQEIRSLLEQFRTTVDEGIQYMDKDFAVLATPASHPGNLKALASLQIFFRRLNTSRRFDELHEDMGGTILHLKDVFHKEIPKVDAGYHKHKVSKLKLKTAVARLAKEMGKRQNQPDVGGLTINIKDELNATPLTNKHLHLQGIESRLVSPRSKQLFQKWTERGSKTDNKEQNLSKTLAQMHCNRELLLLHQLRTVLFLHERIARKTNVFTNNVSKIMPKKGELEQWYTNKVASLVSAPSIDSFGASLDVCPMDEWGPKKTMVPIVLIKCLEYLRKYGLNTEGLFRIPGSFGKIEELKKEFRDDVTAVDLLVLLGPHMSNTVATLLKMFFRELSPEGLFPVACSRAMVDMIKSVQSVEGRVKAIAGILKDRHLMPQVHYDSARVFMQLCKHIMANKAKNKMEARPLAVCLAPTIMTLSERKTLNAFRRQTFMEITEIADQAQDCNRIMETFLKNIDIIFDDPGSVEVGSVEVGSVEVGVE